MSPARPAPPVPVSTRLSVRRSIAAARSAMPPVASAAALRVAATTNELVDPMIAARQHDRAAA